MKKIVKKVIFKIFYWLSYFSKDNQLNFIYYHDVVPVGGHSYMKIITEKFYAQMKYLKENGYNTLSFDDLKNDEFDRKGKNVLISFDDGWLSNYEVVFPIMKELDLKFNIFLETGAIGVKDNYLTWDMVNEMKVSKLAGFGAHTFNHIDARKINESNYLEEIILSNKIIEERSNLIARDFCFPYGYYNKDTINFIEKLKIYDRLYTSDGISTMVKDNLVVIGRIGIENEDSMKSFINKVEGKYNLYYSTINIIRKHVKGEKK